MPLRPILDLLSPRPIFLVSRSFPTPIRHASAMPMSAGKASINARQEDNVVRHAIRRAKQGDGFSCLSGSFHARASVQRHALPWCSFQPCFMFGTRSLGLLPRGSGRLANWDHCAARLDKRHSGGGATRRERPPRAASAATIQIYSSSLFNLLRTRRFAPRGQHARSAGNESPGLQIPCCLCLRTSILYLRAKTSAPPHQHATRRAPKGSSLVGPSRTWLKPLLQPHHYGVSFVSSSITTRIFSDGQISQ